MFEKILNWKLLRGSHEFPGPEGGTCINEAAIVAAGFKYQSVRTADSMPLCFSRSISSFAMYLNDYFDDEARQRLMKYVTRLAGTADVRLVEDLRILARQKVIGQGVAELFEKYPVEMKNFASKWKKSAIVYTRLMEATMPNIFQRPFDHIGYVHMRDDVIALGLKALDVMLDIGNKAEPLETELIQTRFEAIKKAAVPA